jgi:hypothetical protein
VTITSIDEPIPAPDQAPGVGSTSSRTVEPVTPTRDLQRALCCALLVAASVASPGSALLVAPFVPAIVAIRLLRQRAGRTQFLVSATIASLLAAIGAASAHHGYLAAAATGLLLVPALGIVHARAARHDPIDTPVLVEWPEPRLRTGLTPTIGAWLVATLVVAALFLPFADAPTRSAQSSFRDASSIYEDMCADGGIYASRDEYCERLLEQRQDIVEVIGDHGPELLAALIAIFAFGSAATAHLVVLARGRRVSERVRRSWRLRELEFHWSAAYVLALGLVSFMVAGDGGSTLAVAARSIGVGLGTLGVLVVVSQGIGLVAWMFTRGGAPTWYRVALLVFALFVLPVTLTLLFFVGVLDMAVHPRRRALAREQRR